MLMLTVLAALALSLVMPAQPAHAAVSGSGNYSNAAIADKALSYWSGSNTNRAPGAKACSDAQKPGDSGGQCRAFINCIVWMVSGHAQNLGGTDYFAPFLNAGGTEITNRNDLVKGDIIQIGQGTHTTIIVSKVSDGQYMVVDSNHWSDETVGYYQRAVTLDANNRAFRMGKVGPSASDFIGTMVQWDGDTKAQKTSWLVMPDGRRHWVADISNYNCWRALSAGDKGPQPSSILDGVIPDSGQTAWCPAITPPSSRSTMWAGQSLKVNMDLWSSDGRYRLLLQGDRNLVLYGPSGAVWATNRYTGDFVIMQTDCNLVGYNLWSQAAWNSGTGGLGGGCALVVQNDGNLVIYASGGRPVWDRYRGRLV